MSWLLGKIFPSSQPTIKKEEQEDSHSASVVSNAHETHEEVDDEDIADVVVKEQEQSFNGFGEENARVESGDGEEAVSAEAKAGKKERKRKKKRKNGRKSLDVEEQEYQFEEELHGYNEATPAEAQAQEIPEEQAFDGETVSTSLGSQFSKEEYAESAPKPKRSRKSNGTMERKRNTVELNTVPETEVAMLEEQEEDKSTSMLTETKLSKNGVKRTTSRKSRKAVAEEDAQDPETVQDVIADDGDSSKPVELAALVGKIKRAKRKARLSPHKTIEDIASAPDEDDNDSAAMLHRPLHSAYASHRRTGSNAKDDIEASAQLQNDAQSVTSPDHENERESTPQQPSKKALGKRKASEVGVSGSKRRKSQKEKAAGTPDLATFGFIHSSNRNSRAILPKLQRTVTQAFTPINAQKPAILPPAQRVPAVCETEDDDSDVSEFVPEMPKFSELKKKRRLPIGNDKLSKTNPKTPQRGSGSSKKTPKSEAKTPSLPSTAKGRLSNEETKAVCTAVEEYRYQNGLTPFEINDLVQKNAKTDGLSLWKYVYDEVPDISRTKILNLCRRKFHNFEARGSWTEEQDQELREAYERYPGKWKQIGESMSRFAEDCRDRWRNYLVCGDKMKKDAWDKGEEEKLLEVVQECLEAVREIKRVSDDPLTAQISDESLLDWNVVSQKMDRTRSRLQCLNKWKKLKDRQEADVEDPVIAQPISETWRLQEAERLASRMKAKDKLQLLYAIRDSGAGREGKIPWRRVQEDLPGKAPKMAWRVCFRYMRQHIEDHENMKLQDIVDLLIDVFEAAAPAEPTGYDDFHSFQASQRSLSRKMKRKSLGEIDSSDDNGEGPSTITKKKWQSRLSEKYVVDNELDDDVWSIRQDDEPTVSSHRKTASLRAEDNLVDSSGVKKKKKLRERMKATDQGQRQSQETDRRLSEASDDVRTALESLKSGKPKSRSASAKKSTKRVSNERVVKSDEGEPPANEDCEAEHEEMDLEKLETYTATGRPDAEEDVRDLGRREYTAAGGPEAEDDGSSFRDEEDSLKHPDDGSVDLDPANITNGAYDDEGHESDFQDSGSVDLDILVQKNKERREVMFNRSAWPISVEEETHKFNGFTNWHSSDDERVSSNDESVSDIPAEVVPKVVESKRKKAKSKKRRRDLR